jgi:hypothetical protein
MVQPGQESASLSGEKQPRNSRFRPWSFRNNFPPLIGMVIAIIASASENAV